jgi:hypothetical protein
MYKKSRLREGSACQWDIVGDVGDISDAGRVADICDVGGGCIFGDVDDVVDIWYL